MKLSNLREWSPLDMMTFGTGKDYFGGMTLTAAPPPLNDMEPIEVQLDAGIPHNFYDRKGLSVPTKTSASLGIMGGSYDAQLSPRHKEYFGGDFGK